MDNICPTEYADVVILSAGELCCERMRFGLIPVWAKRNNAEAWRKSMLTFNARCETVLDLASYRGPILKQRCLTMPSVTINARDLRCPAAKSYGEQETFNPDTAFITARLGAMADTLMRRVREDWKSIRAGCCHGTCASARAFTDRRSRSAACGRPQASGAMPSR